MTASAHDTATASRGSAGEVFWAFLRLGLTSFGGPIAHLGYFDVTDLFGVIAELEIILDSLGRSVEFGSGVRAVQQVYREAFRPAPVDV